MPLSPDDIREKQFAQRMRGIDPDEVETFLGRIADDLETALLSNEKLEEEIEALQAEINDYQAKEREFTTAILSAHKSSDDLKRKSEKESAELLANANQEAKTLLTNANQESKTLLETTKKEAAQLREAAKQETEALRSKTAKEVEQLQAKINQEAQAIRQDAQKEADTLTAQTIKEVDELKAAAHKEAQQLLDKSKLDAVVIMEKNAKEKKFIQTEINELKSLRTTVRDQMRVVLQSYLDRLEEVGKELGEEEPPPPPKPAAKTQGEKPTAGDDLTAKSSKQDKNFAAMDVDDLTGLYQKIDISDLAGGAGGDDDGFDDLTSPTNRDLSLDDSFDDLENVKPSGGKKK